jgi:transcription elongation GreA/GreB family factor
MSVAFRRESDEEHLEPKFELPIPSGPNLVTARGLRLILARKAELEAEIERSDNDAVLASLRRDLRYWNTRQVTAEIAPVPVSTRVEIGTQVTISLNGKTRTFDIVGHDEAEPAAGLISYDAPLSRAVLGAEVGDELPFGDSPDAIEILEIRVSADDG